MERDSPVYKSLTTWPMVIWTAWVAFEWTLFQMERLQQAAWGSRGGS